MPLRNLAAISLVSLFASVASAQHFPLKPGEWEMTSTPAPGQPPMTLLFCFNDEMWTKGLSQNPGCTIQNLSVNAAGASYNVDCPMRTFQMKGTVTLSFDGITHMTGKGSLDFTVNGKTTHSNTQSDYRWKQSTCSPEDMNLRPHPAH
jgi:hypothetical protein